MPQMQFFSQHTHDFLVINIHTKINSIIIQYYSYLVIQSKAKLTRWNTTSSHSQSRLHARARAHTHTHIDMHTHTPAVNVCVLQSNRANDNGQPGTDVSFSLNGVNEREIWLSLWASKMIQSGQISVRTKSVSELCSRLWLLVAVRQWDKREGSFAKLIHRDRLRAIRTLLYYSHFHCERN